MKVEQISIFLENKSGRMAEVTKVLSDSGINIRALTLADTTDFGILRLIVNDTEKAREVLKENNFTVSKTEVIAVEVSDEPGGLARVLDVIHRGTLNVEYMYGFLEKHEEKAVIIFRFDDPGKAAETLTSAGIGILTGEYLYSM